MISRHRTFPVYAGNIGIGGDNPVTIQSMTNTDTHDTDTTLIQIKELATAGCELVRVAIPDEQSLSSLKSLVKQSPIPLVADIHFDYKLAISAVEAGAQKIRINPGNIGSRDRVEKVVATAKKYSIPIRVGVNSGSLEKRLLKKYGGASPEALVQSAVDNVMMLNEMNFNDVVISIKASDVNTTIEANRQFAKVLSNPLHLGITEAGTLKQGTVKSSVGIGTLLAEGIGDTIRVSLTGSPVEEVSVAKGILSSLNLITTPQLVSCPTCGRTSIAIEKLAEQVDRELQKRNLPITVAVMGCAVNGPGEAREADLGIAGGKDSGVIFRDGEIIRKVPYDQLLDALVSELDKIERERYCV